MLNVQDIFPTEFTASEQLKDNVAFDIKVAFPGIVNSVNSNGTIDVQPAIRDRVKNLQGLYEYIQLPIIPNVPVCFPSSGGCSLRMPIAVGDECLVIICDSSFDYWWLFGGIQNPVEVRRHDLTDAIAIMGIKSTPNSLPHTNTLKLSSPTASIEIGNGVVNVSGVMNVTGNIFVNGREVALKDENS